MKKIIVLLVTLLTLTACSRNKNLTATNLMVGMNKTEMKPIVIDSSQTNGNDKTEEITEFSLAVFRKIYEGKNTLISPLSMISALSMTANGAEKETRTQMEEVFGTDIESLNAYLHAYKTHLPTADQYKVSLANSIWLEEKEGLIVEKDFLQTNKDYYDAEIYKAPFDDTTKQDINAWVNKKTHGQIKELISKKFPEHAVMYLINALSFDAEWQNIYKSTSVAKDEFTSQFGDKKTVEFMHSTEYRYIEVPNARGFLKPYADYGYSFVALLPDEDVKISDFISSLEGVTLMEGIKNQSDYTVLASIPKFAFEYDKELSDSLIELGIMNAFDGDIADFSSLGKSDGGSLFINRVIHKTRIEVNEKGTKAGAVTAVEMADGAAPPTEIKTVHLNRPFFFMIVDNQFHMPIFMGVLNELP